MIFGNICFVDFVNIFCLSVLVQVIVFCGLKVFSIGCRCGVVLEKFFRKGLNGLFFVRFNFDFFVIKNLCVIEGLVLVIIIGCFVVEIIFVVISFVGFFLMISVFFMCLLVSCF